MLKTQNIIREERSVGMRVQSNECCDGEISTGWHRRIREGNLTQPRGQSVLTKRYYPRQ